jgi:hypothetical protein
MLPGNLSVSVVAAHNSETAGAWALGRIKVSEGPVKVNYRTFANKLHGYVLTGRWLDAGDGRFGVYVLLLHRWGFWKILVESSPRGVDEANLTDIAIGIADSAVLRQGTCRGD